MNWIYVFCCICEFIRRLLTNLTITRCRNYALLLRNRRLFVSRYFFSWLIECTWTSLHSSRANLCCKSQQLPMNMNSTNIYELRVLMNYAIVLFYFEVFFHSVAWKGLLCINMERDLYSFGVFFLLSCSLRKFNSMQFEFINVICALCCCEFLHRMAHFVFNWMQMEIPNETTLNRADIMWKYGVNSSIQSISQIFDFEIRQVRHRGGKMSFTPVISAVCYAFRSNDQMLWYFRNYSAPIFSPTANYEIVSFCIYFIVSSTNRFPSK